jgi:hypothetical protein
VVAVPDFFTIEEAARILRIGRTAAYLAAKQFRESNGSSGLPCVAIRGSLRVPRRQLELLAGGPIEGVPSMTRLDVHRTVHPTESVSRTSQSKRTVARHSQRSLPFTG